ncbi:MAG: DNA polymerase III subunit gamma/tau, partial [Deltaproteobacteria bacterium]|nr:DNA polymerase III subunit gamma/tau [Deltaproteobacteria bacterium]
RKWRPQHFEELLGQEHVSQTLKNAILQNRIAHAFLFCGPRGVGKTSAARILAKTLICAKAKEAKSCNQCSACEEISKGISVAVIEIDGASNNGVDSIRELRDRAHYLPTHGHTKVYIIDEVHMLSQSAFNALLKILEEPPAHLKFIFATTEAHKIPMTILSRCQRFDFKKIPLKQLEQHLAGISEKENFKIEKEALTKIAKEAQGSFRDALSLLDQVISFSGNNVALKDLQEILGSAHEEKVLELLEKAFKKESAALLKLLSEIYERGQDMKQLTSQILEYVRVLLLIKISSFEAIEKENFLNLTDYELSRLKDLSGLLSLEEMEQAFHILFKGSQDMALTLYPHMVLETTLIKLLQLKPLISIENLLEKVEMLQKSWRESPFPSVSVQSSAPVVTPVSSSPIHSLGAKNWGTLVEFVKTKKPSLAALLEHSYLVQWADHKITLGLPKGSVFYKLLSDRENVLAFEKVAQEFLNTKATLLVTEMATKGDGSLTNLVQENEQQMDQIKKKVMQHELVQEAQKVFDGKVIDVKVEKRKDSPHE